MPIKKNRDYDKPNWTPAPGDRKAKAKFLHELFALFSPEEQEREKKRRSPCCKDYIGGRYEGARKDDTVHYVKSCSNCDRILYSKHISQQVDLGLLASAETDASQLDVKSKAAGDTHE